MVLRARAATPATVFLIAAFVLLLLSVISVPITKSIALGSFNGVSFGVFGYCVNGKCSPVQLGYNPDRAIQSASASSSRRSLEARQNNPGNNFTLPPSTRNNLSNILIVHVIAAALTLIALILSLVAHVRSPSHSVRLLLAIFIIGILTTILTLLSFLVDLLVFVPHFAFGTWLVLAATICNAVATILLCCGRRTLIGRKAMRRRINENSEMSGANYFKEEAAKEMALRNSDQSKVPQYAEFEVNKPISPDRLPLNPSQTRLIGSQGDRTGSDRSGDTVSTEDNGPGSFRVGLPSGPSPYGAAGYPPAVRMPRPYGGMPPPRTPSDRSYPPPGPPVRQMTPSRSNTSLNSMNRAPRSGYEVPPPLPPPATNLDRHASSVYSEYVPPRRDWGAAAAALPVSRGMDDDYNNPNPYRPERPQIDTYNLERPIRMADNPYVAARRSPDIEPTPASLDRAPNRARRTSETGSMIPSYYEDVDPRFDDPPLEEFDAPAVYQPPPSSHSHQPRRRQQSEDEHSPISPVRRNYSSNSLDNQPEDYRSGPRSPAASTSSHFTSVSQRGVNPRWQPAPPQFIGETAMYPRRNRPRNDQMNFLSGNPDFELPISRSGKRSAPVPPLDGGGRYPLPR